MSTNSKQIIIVATPDRKSVIRTRTEERVVGTRSDGSSFITVKGKRVNLDRQNPHTPGRVFFAA